MDPTISNLDETVTVGGEGSLSVQGGETLLVTGTSSTTGGSPRGRPDTDTNPMASLVRPGTGVFVGRALGTPTPGVPDTT